MFEELRTFLEVAESKSFTKTAKKLNFSQPTVSQQVKKVEIFFNNITLLTRSANTKQIELTEEGNIVYQRGQEILSILDQTFDEIERARDAGSRQLHIGTSMTIGNYMLPKVLKRFSAQHQEVKLNVLIDNTRRICEKLHKGEIDIGLIEGKDMSHNFKRVDFFTDQLVLVAAPGVAAGLSDISASQLGKVQWVSREKGSGTEQYMRSFIESHNIKVESKINYNSNFAIKEVVKEGLGVTFLSRFVVDQELRSGELVIIPFGKPYTRNFSYILPEDRAPSAATGLFIETLVQAGKELQESITK